MESRVCNSATRRSCRRGAGVLIALLAAMAGPAFAASGSGGESRVIADEWVLNVGGFLTDFNTTAAAGTGGAIGTVISLEDELGLEEDKAFLRSDGHYRFNPRHAIGFGYWGLKRSGQRTIDDEIDWDGNVYDVGVVLDTDFNIDWLRVDWRYSFLRTDRGEAGVNIGLSSYNFEVALDGTGTVNGVPNNRVRAEETLFAPVPTFGMFVNFAITPNVLFRGAFNWLDLEAGDIDGSVTDVLLVFEWYFTEHFGIGGGASRTSIDYTDTSDDPLTLDYSQSGFLAYLTFAWGDVD
jgi:hypothetical protein